MRPTLIRKLDPEVFQKSLASLYPLIRAFLQLPSVGRRHKTLVRRSHTGKDGKTGNALIMRPYAVIHLELLESREGREADDRRVAYIV